ncbi:gluconate 2-dehydrogenase subunit 3 family protein [Pseudoteredinibacter isoporae]|uniref:Gluconate 2-dehydrogenase subunit 3 family protein n=1 Tax=Pseudoteredinibacter isoporae TaxID=570281 RepID=A0A7X0JUJ7_9GAMM|nr:gluconate 2-dehydrogenase subunit 3 family protein [Pseudoteredinibacter isoporae]MBB6522545.1 hypothetical protein [Pseudoteredinibacter isoporae]NHO88075.1 gluconate 2-dehydrogenase subunit 3 family protein [Pseudoteredinibacter isoporae]NIB23594.1 gluconate 2-dehydrogenase subunit 3 family protein [Pseudoteredinibacter isoporae]
MSAISRREALKTFALSTGAVVSTGTLGSLLQGCQTQSQAALEWSPEFFSPKEAEIISRCADIILPRTESPGALDVAVPQFIDLLYKDIFSAEQAKRFQLGIEMFNLRFRKQHHGQFSQSEATQQSEFVHSLYDLPEAEEQRLLELIKKGEPEPQDKVDYALYSFLISMRELTIQAYFTSETIGEQHLAYLPIPGEYDGDFKADENTKVWSL